jgi:hypothetical protein
LTIDEEVQFVEYAPLVFLSIKEADMIDNELIRTSLSTDLNRERAFKAGES